MDNNVLERICYIRDHYGLNVKSFAAKLGEKPNKITKILNGHQELKLDFLLHITIFIPLKIIVLAFVCFGLWR